VAYIREQGARAAWWRVPQRKKKQKKNITTKQTAALRAKKKRKKKKKEETPFCCFAGKGMQWNGCSFFLVNYNTNFWWLLSLLSIKFGATSAFRSVFVFFSVWYGDW
jgi:hypothetical protein